MYDAVECPYCEEENDMSNALDDGCPSDNKFDQECQHCGKEFEVYVEFEPTYSASKIEYEDCDICGKSVRDIYKKGRVVPYPNALQGKKACEHCFFEALSKHYDKS